jgi:glucose/arabinose dehydrogenase
MDIAPDGRVFIIQRDGFLKVWHPDTGMITTAGQLPADCAPLCPNAKEQLNDDGGMMGMVLDSNFEHTGRIFFSWTPAGTTVPFGPKGAAADGTTEGEVSLFSKIRVSSFALDDGGMLDMDSEQIAIEDYAYNTPQSNGAHSFGGDLNWMADGSLLWSTGDATGPRINGYSPQDNRPGMAFNNALRTASNPRSLWGKIVRMKLRSDGRAVIPTDNPGVRDPETFRDWNPFVYAMGYRNPFRFAVEPATQRLFVGMVGPDANADDPNRGPHGRETIHTVEPGGGQDGGWPKCIANNTPYRAYDELTMTPGEHFDCEALGVTPATFWYGRGPSPWSAVLDGSCALDPMIYPADPGGPRALPERFWNQLIHIDWSSGQIALIPVRPDGTLDTTVPDIDPSIDDTAGPHPSGITGLVHPIDAVMGPDGALYILNYGSSFWGNTNGSFVRVVPASAPAAPAAPSGKAARAPEARRAVVDRPEALATAHGPARIGRVAATGARPLRAAAVGLLAGVAYAVVLLGRRRLRTIA